MTAEPEPPSWAVLLTLMVHGPDPEPSIRGTIRASGDDDGGQDWVVMGDEPVPIFTGSCTGDGGSTAPLRVWRDGPLVRVEQADGTVSLIASADTCWIFDGEHDAPERAPRRALRYGGRGTELMGRRPAEDFLARPRRHPGYSDDDGDYTTPTGAIGVTTFLGRTAWTVELAPPRRKAYPMQLVVDAETGIVLQQRLDGAGLVMEWLEFAAGEQFDPALFGWDGPVRERRDPRAEREAEHRADVARRRAWFGANVAPVPLTVELKVEPFVHWWDEDSGAFEASLGQAGIASLARRPRSDEPWDLDWHHDSQYRWSTARWDWALAVHETRLSPSAVEALKRQLPDG